MHDALAADLQDDVSLLALLKMSGRGFDAAVEKEGAAITALGEKLGPVFARSVEDGISTNQDRRIA
ncbi:MAG: hypothetical protein WBB85_01320 [Albidovulum sp.]|uniref:hypothetical protein n=1 Tax=Albidovulum sp. TaxID=1872424 RepID=UPI003CB124FA